MTTCGYVCPQCEGSGFLESGEACDWCTAAESIKPRSNEINDLPKKELSSED